MGRLHEDVAGLLLGDFYELSAPQWQFSRQDINEAHGVLGGDVDDTAVAGACGWVSTDVGRVGFYPVPAPCGNVALQLAEPGRYHLSVETSWQCFPLAESSGSSACPGNVGGVHALCIDTAQPGS